MILKIGVIVLTTSVCLLQIGLEYKWHDKRTATHRKIRRVLIGAVLIGLAVALVLVYSDDQDTKVQLTKLSELKDAAVRSADEAQQREHRAQNDRDLIQKNLNDLKSQIEPILVLAMQRYPNLSSENALGRLSKDLKALGRDLEKTKSTIHSFSSELTLNIRASWTDGKVPVTPGIISLGSGPELWYSVVLSSGETRLLAMDMDGMGRIEKQGELAIINYKAKALAKSWILGHDLRDIKGFTHVRGILYSMKKSNVSGPNVYVERIMFEIFANGQTIAKFDDKIEASVTIPDSNDNLLFNLNIPMVKNTKRK